MCAREDSIRCWDHHLPIVLLTPEAPMELWNGPLGQETLAVVLALTMTRSVTVDKSLHLPGPGEMAAALQPHQVISR